VTFRIDKTIRFSQCDPAGIVFYPRYAELCNEVVEDWFAHGLGVSFVQLHDEMRLGVPAVRLEIEYLQPSRLGEVLTFNLTVAEIGNSSFTLAIAARRGDETRVRIGLKSVLISMDSMRPVAIDAVWRERFAPYCR
jgi:4-hydroxybenzoyl-CoA thioesterase